MIVFGGGSGDGSRQSYGYYDQNGLGYYAKKAEDYRVVLWGMHGVFGMGNDLDEAFGLIETVEKAATIYFLTLDHVRQTITDENLKELAEAFHVNYKKII